MTWTLQGKPLQSILVSRLRYLGDVVMSTVVLEVLHEGDPNLRLGFLCERQHAPVLAGHPLLNRLHILAVKRSGTDASARHGSPGVGGPGKGLLGTIQELRATRYDLAVDLFFNPRSAWLLRLSGIPARIGGTRGSRRHLYTHTVLRPEMAGRSPGFDELAPGGLGEHLSRLEPLVHQESGLPFAKWFPERYRAGQLRPRLGAPGSTAATSEILAQIGLPPNQPFFILAPGATWATKEWPLARWRELASKLVAADPSGILVLAPPGPVNPWSALGEVIPMARGGVLPALDLGQVLGLLAQAAVVVAVDGGIMHAAVGLGIPTVGLFGPTRLDTWFPYEGSGPFAVLATKPPCHPCDLHECTQFICLPDLEPARVLEAVNRVQAG